MFNIGVIYDSEKAWATIKHISEKKVAPGITTVIPKTSTTQLLLNGKPQNSDDAVKRLKPGKAVELSGITSEIIIHLEEIKDLDPIAIQYMCNL